jgi:hypothetical protein
MKRQAFAVIVLALLFTLAIGGSALAYKGHTAPDLKSSRLTASSAAPGFWNITLRWDLKAGRPTHYMVAREFKSGGWQADDHRLTFRQIRAGRATIGPLSGADVLSFQLGVANRWGDDWGRLLFPRSVVRLAHGA